MGGEPFGSRRWSAAMRGRRTSEAVTAMHSRLTITGHFRRDTMKLGLSIGYSGADLRLPMERIQLAERLGYDSIWTAEAYGSDAVTPLAYVAATTTRVRLGTGIMQLAG